MTSASRSKGEDDYPPVVVGQLIERQAVTRFIAFQVARAGYRLAHLRWWQFFAAREIRWTLAALTVLLKDIEEGKQQNRQASWMIDIENGDWIDRSIAAHLTDQEGQNR
jgi:hypothetical protein